MYRPSPNAHTLLFILFWVVDAAAAAVVVIGIGMSALVVDGGSVVDVVGGRDAWW